MRIAVLCHMHHPIAEPFQGGTETHTANLADELVARGHDVTLFAKEGSETTATVYPLVPADFEFVFAASPLVRFRWAVLAAWLLLALALGRPASLLPDRLVTTSAVPGSESAQVQRELAERFASPFAQWALLVVSGAPAPDSPEGAAVLARVAAACSVTVAAFCSA